VCATPTPSPHLLHKIFIRLELGSYLKLTLVAKILIALGLGFDVLQNIQNTEVTGKQKGKPRRFASATWDDEAANGKLAPGLLFISILRIAG
jgi:hypothetical protein